MKAVSSMTTNGIVEPDVLNAKPFVSIVVPVFNEQESLPILYERLREVLEGMAKPFEILFIDDGSRDDSVKMIRDISDKDHRVKGIRLRRNFGQTPALTAGFDAAEGDVVITMDADLQNDPADIPLLLEKLDEGYDIVSGWRRSRKDPFITKSLPSRFSNKMASWLSGVHLHDFGCTLKAYRSEVVKEIHLYGELHRFIPAVASSIGVKVAEVEVQHHPRSFGKSKYGVSRLVRGLLDLFALKMLLTYMNRPMQMFGTLGLLSIMLGVVTGIATVGMKVIAGVDITGNPALYITMMLILAGFQFLSLGFIGEMNTRTYHETQRKPIYVVQEIIAFEGEVTPSKVS